MNDLPAPFKVVRTDRELEMPRVDARAARRPAAGWCCCPTARPRTSWRARWPTPTCC